MRFTGHECYRVIEMTKGYLESPMPILPRRDVHQPPQTKTLVSSLPFLRSVFHSL